MSRQQGYAEYNAPWDVYSVACAPSTRRIACSSFRELTDNKIALLEYYQSNSESDGNNNNNNNNNNGKLRLIADAPTVYPATKVLWSPQVVSSPSMMSADTGGTLVASTSDYLRLWRVEGGQSPPSQQQSIETTLTCVAVLANVSCLSLKQSKSAVAAPLTSFDWCKLSANLVVTSSVDTTCTVWDIETKQAKTQLIAHDKEVFDVSFVSGTKDIFSSVGADGSVRMFDLRSLEHSTIIYETSSELPLLRLSWNVQDPNYLAVTTQSSPVITVLDIRVPSVPVAELSSTSTGTTGNGTGSTSSGSGIAAAANGQVCGHTAQVNAIAWASHSSGTLMSCGEDGLLCVWDLTVAAKNKNGYAPVLSTIVDREVITGCWTGWGAGEGDHDDSIAISSANKVVLMRV